GQDVGVVGDAGHADAVVGGLRAGGAGHVGAVPGTVALLAGFRAGVADGPVAEVPAAGHALVGVASRHERVGDEVVALVGERGVDVGVFADAGVEHRDGDAVAVGQVPGGRDVGAAAVGTAVEGGGTVRGEHVPLVLDEIRIVGDVGRLHARQAHGVAGDLAQAVRPYRDHVGIGLDLPDQRVRLDTVQAARQPDQVLPGGELAHVRGGRRAALRQSGTRQCPRHQRRAGVAVALLARAVAVLHDKAVERLLVAQARRETG